MDDLEPSDASPTRDSDIPNAGHDPRDPLRPEVDEEPRVSPLGVPQQDIDATEDKGEVADEENEPDMSNNADLHNDDDKANDSDAESELSEIDEAQFANFDPNAIAIEEPVAIDGSNVNLLKAAKRKRVDGEEEPAKKKKKRKESKREKLKRPQRAVSEDDNFSGGEEIEGKRRRKPKDPTDGERKERIKPRKATPENEEDLTPEERRKRALDRAMDAALKKPNRRRKLDGIDLESQNDELIEKMRIRMTDAAKADTEAREQGMPAMAKLKLLPEVVSLLNRNSLRDQLVDPDTNLLEAVRFFLEPLNDGSLPAYNIQRELFAALGKLPINKDALVASGIGKVTMFYTLSKRPELAVKREAEKLLGAWMRPIMKKSSSFRERTLDEAVYDPRTIADQSVFSGSTSGVGATSIALAAREKALAAPGKGNRARVEGGQGSYTVVPRSNAPLGGLSQRIGGGGEELFRRVKARKQGRV